MSFLNKVCKPICNPVLPTSFSDAISYYEELCKVVSRMNEVIDTTNEQTGIIEELNNKIDSFIEEYSPYVLPQATANALGGVKAVAKTSSETVEVKIDTETGKLYVPAGESYTLPQATENALGGVKAAAKTSAETVEVKIDSETGKLYVPTYPSQYVLPQATANALGGVKADAKTSETVEVKIDSETGKLYVPTYPSQYVLPQASANTLGGIKADAKTASDTVNVKIDGTTGKLYVNANHTYEKGTWSMLPQYWQPLSGNSPFNYQYGPFTEIDTFSEIDIDMYYRLVPNIVFELVNNDPVLFAKYGFSIVLHTEHHLGQDYTSLYVYSIGLPEQEVRLEVMAWA